MFVSWAVMHITASLVEVNTSLKRDYLCHGKCQYTTTTHILVRTHFQYSKVDASVQTQHISESVIWSAPPFWLSSFLIHLSPLFLRHWSWLCNFASLCFHTNVITSQRLAQIDCPDYHPAWKNLKRVKTVWVEQKKKTWSAIQETRGCQPTPYLLPIKEINSLISQWHGMQTYPFIQKMKIKLWMWQYVF